MNTEILTDFKIKDKFEYDFPYGHWAEPQIRVLSGPYKGLVVDVMCSGIGKNSDESFSKFTYTYKILKKGDHSPEEIISEDEQYIGKLILNLIKQENSNA